MAETVQSLEELSTLKPTPAPQTPTYVQVLDKQGRAYATGKRKDAVARVWIKMGAGKILVNERAVEVYFARPVLRMLIQQPLVAANRQGQYDVVCTVSGGGLVGAGRRGAPRHIQGADPARARTAPRAQARRLRHPRLARGRAQEIRQGQSAPQLPVLEAVILVARIERSEIRERLRGIDAAPGLRIAQSGLQTQKNASVRISMLSRGRACGGVVGSSNAVCAVQRARPSFIESNTLKT